MKQKFQIGEDIIVSMYIYEENRYRDFFATVIDYNEKGYPNKKGYFKRYRVQLSSGDFYDRNILEVAEYKIRKRQ